MTGYDKVSHFMVRNPIIASLWQPISSIRQTMLANSFSYLPVLKSDDQWRLVSDYQIVKFLRVGGKRNDVMTRSLKDALSANIAIFRWERPRPRGQTLGGDPGLSPGDSRKALPALVAGAPPGSHASENRYKIKLHKPHTCSPNTKVADALKKSNNLPILVLSPNNNELIGILTAFDVL